MYRGEGVCRKGGVLVPDTGRKCGRKKRKTSEGWKDETRSKDEKRARMLIGLKLNPTHLSLPVWSVRPPFSLFPSCSQDRWHRGQKSGTRSRSPRAHLSAEDSLAEASGNR